MLTLYENIQRYMRRYNKKRGSALLMVLMTMSVLIVVGSSMLFITLSSFSTSIADTNQSAAYNAALAVSENVQNNLQEVLLAYESRLPTSDTKTNIVFSSDDKFDSTETVDTPYTMINGVKVSVEINRLEDTSETEWNVLVRTTGEKHGQIAMVAFKATRSLTTRNFTIEDTYGNAFVMNSSLGGEEQSPYLVLKRIEGDVSINCYDDNGVMTTHIFNPTVLEGVTGSIFANGDLIIGGPDNILKVQGSIYVDGNLTIRGLRTGVELAALKKSDYRSKYMNYYTTTPGWIEENNSAVHRTGTASTAVTVANSLISLGKTITATVGDPMYEKISDTKYIPQQVYDDITHYTLIEKVPNKTFWTKEYTFNENALTGDGDIATTTWKQITVDNEPDKNYFGAVMYYPDDDYKGEITADGTITGYTGTSTPKGMITQFAKGGNIYCSGDIIFDAVNSGTVQAYNSKEELKDYYSLDEENPNSPAINKSEINGDVYCLGRMIIAPNKTASGLVIDDAFVSGDRYLTNVLTNSADGRYGNATAFQAFVKGLWDSPEHKTLDAINLSTYSNNRWSGTYYSRYDFDKDNKSSKSNYESGAAFLSEAQTAVGATTTAAKARALLATIFNNKVSSKMFGDYLSSSITGSVPIANANMRTVKFAETSNLYIYNSPDAPNDSETNLSSYAAYAATDALRIVSNTINDTHKQYSVVNGVKYTDALTVKFAQVTLNNVYLNGSVNVIASTLPGYLSPARLTVTNGILTTEQVSTVYSELSIKDIVKLNNPATGTENADTKAETILKDNYWTYKDTNNKVINLFSGTSEVNFSIADSLTRGGNTTPIVAIRAHMRDTYATTNAGLISSYLGSSSDFNKVVLDYYAKNNGTSWAVYNSSDTLVPESSYDSIFGQKTATNNERNFIDYLISSGNNLKLSEMYYLDVLADTYDHDGDYKSRTGYLDIEYKLNGVEYDDTITSYTVISALRRYYFDRPMSLAKLSNSTDCDSVTVNLDYENDIKALNDVKMLALFSNSASSSQNAILDKSISNNNYYSASKITDKTFGTLISATRAFAGKPYGMYLRDNLEAYQHNVNGKNANGEYTAYVEQVFDEIRGDNFARVQVADFNKITTADMPDLIAKHNLTVYNDIKIISNTNENPLYKVERKRLTIARDASGEFIRSPMGVYPNGATISGYEDGAGDRQSFIVWCHTQSAVLSTYVSGDGFLGTGGEWLKDLWIIKNTSNRDTNVRVMQFTNKNDSSIKWTCESTLSADPLYNDLDEEGNPQEGSLLSTSFRSQVDYVIDKNVYFDMSNVTGAGAKNSSGQVFWGASDDYKAENILNTVRMNVEIDTSKQDIYVYINAPRTLNADGSYTNNLLFQKCTFQVTGENNAYFILVGDSGISCNAYSLEVVTGGGIMSTNGDVADARVGTHFFSGSYDIYNSQFMDVTKSGGTTRLMFAASYSGITEKVGDLFILGTGENEILVGRGGYINGFAYMPEGTYTNYSKGILNLLPVASSNNNKATIVAKNVQIIGSNAGKLIFSSFSPSTTGGATTSATGVINEMSTTVTQITTVRSIRWSFGSYYTPEN